MSDSSDDQSYWDDVTDWAQDVAETVFTPIVDAGGGMVEAVQDAWAEIEQNAAARRQTVQENLGWFRGHLNSAAQAVEVLNVESDPNAVLHASGMIGTAAHAAHDAGTAVGEDTAEGQQLRGFSATLSITARNLEESSQQQYAHADTLQISLALDAVLSVGRESESLLY